MNEQVQEVEVDKTETVTGKVKFGLGQISQDNTPKWATIVFRYYFYIAGLVGVVVSFEPAIPITIKDIIYRYLLISTMAVHGLSKMLGVDTSQNEADANSVFTKKP